MSLNYWLQPAIISIIVSIATSCIVGPWASAHLSWNNTKKIQKNKALVDTVSELIGKMEQINGYLFTLDGDAMDKMWVRKYRTPMVDTEFVNKHKEDLTQLNIFVSATSLFWKEHEDYFNDISDSEIANSFETYLKLVTKILFGLHSAFEAIDEGREQQVVYPDIPPDILLHDALIKLGNIRWKIINQQT